VADETEKERIDRELIELLNEIRVALPGVQVLFAFLLVLPFQNRFHEAAASTRAVYIVALVLTAAASSFLIAPGAYHRLNFRSPDKERMLFTANRFAITGMVLLGVAVSCALYVVVAFLYGTILGAALAASLGILIAWLWYGLPLVRRARS
jgi:hypothetical protein